MRGFLVFLLLFACALVSCGTPPSGCTGNCGDPFADAAADGALDVVTRVCVPGATQECACGGGVQGVQTCADDGLRFGACMGCPSPDAGQPQDVCVRNCAGRECGSDGCMGSCGTCSTAGWGCSGAGRCVPPDMVCRSACAGRECGPDTGMFCDGMTCGSLGGACPSGSACSASGRCVCTRNCTGRECGPDGCGGSCGTCAVGRVCDKTATCRATTGCTSMCDGRMCGPDPGPGCAALGRTCGTCPSGFSCNAAGTACGVNGSSNWIVTAVRGAVARTPVTSGSWDIDGSPPDPYLCLTMNGMQRCTEYITDSFAPTWRMGVFPATTAASLMSGVPSTYGDDDVGADDPICAPGPITFTAAQLSAGAPVTFSCGTTGSFTLTVAPAP